MVSNLELQNKIAILLVSHGSSLPFAEVTFNEIKDKFMPSAWELACGLRSKLLLLELLKI